MARADGKFAILFHYLSNSSCVSLDKEQHLFKQNKLIHSYNEYIIITFYLFKVTSGQTRLNPKQKQT